MIPKSLHERIFDRKPCVSEEAVARSKHHLLSHGIDVENRRGTKLLRNVNVDLPPLSGRNINDHFVSVATEQTEPYLSLAKSLARASLPQIPRKWRFAAGWTKYDERGVASAVAYPEEDALVFDVEVCMRDSDRPIMASAVSDTHWYSWVSERLALHQDYSIDVQGGSITSYDLIPLEPEASIEEEEERHGFGGGERRGERGGRGREERAGGGEIRRGGEGRGEKGEGREWRKRIVIGHNVGYDRARIKEQYLMKVSYITSHEVVRRQENFSSSRARKRSSWTL